MKALKFFKGIKMRTDIAVAVFIIGIIFMMIIPLPTGLVDSLIAMNMGISVILLMVAVYLKNPLEFLAFPAVLLVTTLFRLALSITTTRLILLEADAGEIIHAFGNFVVGGDLIVGLVIFLIITIVQFLVITKGSERVAEVSARFSLDGMPGKQMSIDSDMRSGLIDMEEARRRRGDVQYESQLFGSMDGAMKFVKGDAIAGVIIILVNIIGGIAIGTLNNGQSMGEAVELYSILTIGDGLIAQIPALIISITAGIIVTRVSTEDSKDLGTDIVSQILTKPPAFMVGSGICFVFAIVPGFPTPIFLALGGAFAGVYFFSQKKMANSGEENEVLDVLQKGRDVEKNEVMGTTSSDLGISIDKYDFSVPIIVDVSPKMKEHIDFRMVNDDIKAVRKALYIDLGVPFPGINIRFNHNLDKNVYNILFQETPMCEVELEFQKILVDKNFSESLRAVDVPYQRGAMVIPDIETLWVDEKHEETLKEFNLPYFDFSRIISYHCSYILREYSHEFIGLQETHKLLEMLEKSHGELVKELKRLLPIQKVAEILKRLVSEDISIRNLKSICEILVDWAQKEKDSVLLTEYVRSGLKRYISYKYSNGKNILACYLFDQKIEEAFRSSIRQTSAGSYLALEPAMTEQITKAIRATVTKLVDNNKAVIVTPMDIRRYVKKLVDLEKLRIEVISYQELNDDIVIQPLKKINLD